MIHQLDYCCMYIFKWLVYIWARERHSNGLLCAPNKYGHYFHTYVKKFKVGPLLLHHFISIIMVCFMFLYVFHIAPMKITSKNNNWKIFLHFSCSFSHSVRLILKFIITLLNERKIASCHDMNSRVTSWSIDVERAIVFN